jgi:hypothetical protein
MMNRPVLGLAFAFASSAGCAASGTDMGDVDGGAGGSDAHDDTTSIDSPFTDASGCMQDGSVISVGPGEDHDGDGWTIDEGDCNDCDPNTNPGAKDVQGSGVDEDCSGVADDEDVACDTGISLATNVPEDGARALGLCRFSRENPGDPRERRWGVIEAAFGLADGTPGMHHASRGVLADFGPAVKPQRGDAMLVLSSATARRPGDQDYLPPLDADMGTTGPAPPGWPKASPSCANVPDPSPVANDSASLLLRIRVPTNARGLSFRFAFFTTEFPSWVCHQYNDAFAALLTSSIPTADPDGNISYDGEGNPISANTVWLEVCRPQVVGGEAYGCLQGDALLAGNGFGPSEQEPRGHGATGWLETTAAVAPGEVITLRFAIWDAGDHAHGSTVLIDDFRWIAEAGEAGTVRVPSPK